MFARSVIKLSSTLGYKPFSVLNSAELEIYPAKIYYKNNNSYFSGSAEQGVATVLLINKKLLTIVGVLILISGTNFMLS